MSYKKMRAIFSYVLCLCMVLAVPANAVAPEDYGGADDYGVTILNNEQFIVERDEFENLMAQMPNVAAMPKFKQLQAAKTQVVLTPQDVWMMYAHNESFTDPEKVQQIYGGRAISVFYQDGMFTVISQTETYNTDRRGGEGISTTVQKISKNSILTRKCIYVEVSARCNQVWAGGSTAYFEYLDHAYSTPTKPPDLINPETYTVAKMSGSRAEHSTVSDTKAWLKVWIDVGELSMGLYDRPAHTSFTWG